MTEAELYALLISSGLPFAYHHYNKPPALPYGIYIITGSNNFAADGKVYHKINQCQVELYTNIKDPATEKALEDVLDGAGIFYNKTETYIESEKMYQNLYELEI